MIGLFTRRFCSYLIGSYTSNITTIIFEQIVKRFLFCRTQTTLSGLRSIILQCVFHITININATIFYGVSRRWSTGNLNCYKRIGEESNLTMWNKIIMASTIHIWFFFLTIWILSTTHLMSARAVQGKYQISVIRLSAIPPVRLWILDKHLLTRTPSQRYSYNQDAKVWCKWI